MLSIVIPTFQEEKSIKKTLNTICSFLEDKIEFEIIIIDDKSQDDTHKIISRLPQFNKTIFFYLNESKPGFGNSIIKGIHFAKGTYVTIMMADLSDSVQDLLKYYHAIVSDDSLDCIFGDRWVENSVKNYPKIKRIINRVGNNFLRLIFNSDYSDFTNSFKLYKRESILTIEPIISNHFSITIELPLKMITRGFNYIVIPNKWENREHGISNMKIINSIFTYSLITIYCLIDKYFWNKRYVNKT
jgi:dolichol-phosphate mannosyltransferase